MAITLTMSTMTTAMPLMTGTGTSTAYYRRSGTPDSRRRCSRPSSWEKAALVIINPKSTKNTHGSVIPMIRPNAHSASRPSATRPIVE
jgi:hypothetical protein